MFPVSITVMNAPLRKHSTRLLFRPASVWYTMIWNDVKLRWPHRDKGLYDVLGPTPLGHNV